MARPVVPDEVDHVEEEDREAIAVLVERLMPGSSTGDRRWRVLQFHDRPFSCTVVIELCNKPDRERIVVKRVRHHSANLALTRGENQAVVEFAALSELHPRFEEIPGCALPRPLALDEQREAYAMSYVEGSLLVDELRFANHLAHLDGFRSLERGYALAGRWLSHLREVTGVTDGGSRALDGIELRYRERAEMVRRSPMGGGYAALLGHIDGLMQAWRRSLSAAAIPTSGRHGDYGPWNMIFDGRRLVVIDFLGYQRDPILVDVLKILVHLEEVRSGFAASGRRVNRLKEAFLGAAGPLPSVPFELAAFVECAQRVVCWAGVETRSAKGALKRYDHRRTRERLLAWFASLPAVRPLWPTVS